MGGSGVMELQVPLRPELPAITGKFEPGGYNALYNLKEAFNLRNCNYLIVLAHRLAVFAKILLPLDAISMSYHAEDLVKLQQYSACDISDALLKLKVPGAGFVADLNLYSSPEGDATSATVAPVSTVLFASKGQDLPEIQKNIPEGTHWADLTEPGTIVVLKQPDGQKNAVCGGIMAVRMKVCQAKGIVVAGRARDIAELKSTSLPIWARGLSTVGVGGGSVPWAIQVPLDIDGTLVSPGDLAFSDPINGVVVIPQNKVFEVLELLPKLTAADEKVKEDVLKGATVFESFKLHRSNL